MAEESGRGRRRLVRDTFRGRAPTYEGESKWNSSLMTVLPLLEAAQPAQGPLLDLCAGKGLVGLEAARQGWPVVFADLSAEMLAPISRLNTVMAQAEQLPFRDDSFDLVVCRQGMQYLDLDKALPEIRRVSRRLALTHIVAPLEEDVELWLEYFSKASPGRRRVLVRGGLEREINRRGYDCVWRREMQTRENALGPVAHLQFSERGDIVADLIQRLPSHYMPLSDASGPSYLCSWELMLFSRSE